MFLFLSVLESEICIEDTLNIIDNSGLLICSVAIDCHLKKVTFNHLCTYSFNIFLYYIPSFF